MSETLDLLAEMMVMVSSNDQKARIRPLYTSSGSAYDVSAINRLCNGSHMRTVETLRTMSHLGVSQLLTDNKFGLHLCI